jgi:hypothetical protein
MDEKEQQKYRDSAGAIDKAKLISIYNNRFTASSNYCQPQFEEFYRYYKMYMAQPDNVPDQTPDKTDESDDWNIILPYAFGLIQDFKSKLLEPLFSVNPACAIYPKNKDDEPKRDSFVTMCRDYFSGTKNQIEKTRSTDELCVTGNAYELDTWVESWIEVKRWGYGMADTVINGVSNLTGTAKIPLVQNIKSKLLSKMTERKIEKLGYECIFPSVFDVFPEPNCNNIEDMEYCIILQRKVSLKNLESMTYQDKDGQEQKVYDFSELRADNPAGVIKPLLPFKDASNYGEMVDVLFDGNPPEQKETGTDDIDSVTLAHIYEKNRLWTVANDKYVVRMVEDYLDKPRIPIRHLSLFLGKTFWGVGIIEVIQNCLMQMNDIHNLALQMWFRMLNTPILMAQEAMLPETSLESRTKGFVKVKGTNGPLSNVCMPIPFGTNPIGDMLTTLSLTKGNIEQAIGVADFQPGEGGTKAYHKTARGILEIKQELANRIKTVRRILMSNIAAQCESMYHFYSQFLTQKAAFRQYSEDGKFSGLSEMDWEDIDTEGRGFVFVVEEDPAFGDEILQKQQIQELMPQAIQYNQYIQESGQTDKPMVDVSQLMKKQLKSIGFRDTSSIFSVGDGTIKPEAELQSMLKGEMPEPNPKDNHTEHIGKHIAAINSPAIIQGIQSNKVDPKILQMIQQHIEHHKTMVGAMLQNPQLMEGLANGGQNVGAGNNKAAK